MLSVLVAIASQVIRGVGCREGLGGAAMCNLYSIKTRRADLARRFALSDNRMAAFEPLEAIFPALRFFTWVA